MATPLPRPRWRAKRRGFTLLETAIAMMIISVAVVAMCGLLVAGMSANISGNEMTTAVNLAGTIHEIAVGLPLQDGGKPVIGPYRCVWDLNGLSFSPAIDGERTPIPEYAGWTQQVIVQTVDNKNVGTVVASDRSAPTARLTVTIYHKGHYVYAQGWLMAVEDPL